MRLLSLAVFALAASAATFAGAGLAVAPHHHPANAAPDDHPLAAYRLPVLLLVEHARHHHALAPASGGVGPSFAAADDLTSGDATLLLVSLARTAPRLPRPSLRAIAEFVARPLDEPQWRGDTPTGPPRAIRSSWRA